MEKRAKRVLFAEAVFGGKIDDIDAVERAIGARANELLNGGDGVRIGRLPQNR